MFPFSKIQIGIMTIFFVGIGLTVFFMSKNSKPEIKGVRTDMQNHWFVLHRKSNVEELYFGMPGVREKSKLVKTFKVKSGIPGERPTPLPQLVNREYWLITAKEPVLDNPETAPYFITLDVPAPDEPPYGPTPYLECNGQCDWVTPGAFGLHGVNGDLSRLTDEDLGSSGCVRHSDEDITYLYSLIDPDLHIRYYIQDN